MVGDLADDVAQIGLGIKAVHLRPGDEFQGSCRPDFVTTCLLS